MSSKWYITLIIIGIVVIVIMLINKDHSTKHKGHKIVHNDIVENFPDTTQNVLLTDSNGNLSATSDLGLQKLTITGSLEVKGSITGPTIDDLQAKIDDNTTSINTINNTTIPGLQTTNTRNASALTTLRDQVNGMAFAHTPKFNGEDKDYSFVNDYINDWGGGGEEVQLIYIKIPGSKTLIQGGLSSPPDNGLTYCVYPVPFASITKSTFISCCNRYDYNITDRTFFLIDSNNRSTSKCNITWQVTGTYD